MKDTEKRFAMTGHAVFGPCPRCKQVHEIDTTERMQLCPFCETRWPREKNK